MLNFSLFILAITFVLLQGQSTSVNIKTLPNYEGNGTPFPTVYNGYLQVRTNPNPAFLFYWFITTEQNPSTAPLIVWLQGGPGCSSSISLFFENGPFKMLNDSFIVPNPNSWTQSANMLYIDQPLGTGFSYMESVPAGSPLMPSTSSVSSVDLYNGILEFLKLFPSFQKNPLFISGESYAGKWIPYLCHYVLSQPKAGFTIKGVLMGNVMIYPIEQYEVYGSGQYTVGLGSYRSLVDQNQLYTECMTDVQTGNWPDTLSKSCIPLWMNVLTYGQRSGFDTRYSLDYPDHLIEALKQYYLTPTVLTALSIHPNSQYANCNNETFKNYYVEFNQAVPNEYLTEMLNAFPVLFYTGQFDSRAGSYGINEYLRKFNWTGQQYFDYFTENLFTINGVVHGQFKEYQNLFLLMVYGAGHMVPMTQGFASLTMIQRFTAASGPSLCEYINPSTCVTSVTCPSMCGGASHGTCLQAPVCSCSQGYSGVGCGVGVFNDYNIGETVSFNGSILGKDMHIYQLNIPYPLQSLAQIQVVLTRTSPVGYPYLLMNVEDTDSIWPVYDVRALIFSKFSSDFGQPQNLGFPFMNLSMEGNLILSGEATIYRGVSNTIMVVVYNSDNYRTDYQLVITSVTPAGAMSLNGVLLIFFLFLCLFILLEFLFLYQYNKRLERGSSVSYVTGRSGNGARTMRGQQLTQPILMDEEEYYGNQELADVTMPPEQDTGILDLVTVTSTQGQKLQQMQQKSSRNFMGTTATAAAAEPTMSRMSTQARMAEIPVDIYPAASPQDGVTKIQIVEE